METNGNMAAAAHRSGPERFAAPAAQDALGFLRRRKAMFFFVAVPILLGAILLAFKLPSIYQSEAKVLIEQPAIPENIVASTITSYVDERIQSVSQRVLAASNVSQIVESLGLYPELRGAGGVVNQTVIEQFRGDVEQKNIAAEIFDARRGRMDGSTYAFVIGFRHSDAELAREVTGSLVQLYLEENAKSRTEKSAETTLFLEQQAERLSQQISEIEKKLADFKAQYGGAMPERYQVNMQMLDRVERELTDIETEIRQLSSERDLLRFELQGINPHGAIMSSDGGTVLGAQERLQALQLEYMRLTSTYGAEHPDVMRTKREIDAILGGESAQSADEVALRLNALRAERGQLLDRYSSEHPDVKKIDRTIATVEQQLQVIQAMPGGRVVPPPPNNPAYVQKQLQIEGISARLSASQDARAQALVRRNELELNISRSPTVEKEWLELNRGYNSLKENYEEINLRISAAMMSERLESQNKGERFTLLERASLPSEPIEPNRFAIIFLGVVLALGAGLGMAALIDGVDSTVRSSKDLEAIFGETPLVAIPFVETTGDRRIRWAKHVSITCIFAIAIAAVFTSI